MTTIKTKTAPKMTEFEKKIYDIGLDFSDVKGLSTMILGALSHSHDADCEAFNGYQVAFKNGARHTDLIPMNKVGSTATAEGLMAYKLMGIRKAWSPVDVSFMSTPAPAPSDKSEEAVETRDKRKKLQNKARSVQVVFQKGLKTQAKLADPENFAKSAGESKLAIVEIGEGLDKLQKIAQGNKALPESFDCVRFIEVIKVMRLQFKAPTKIIDLDAIV